MHEKEKIPDYFILKTGCKTIPKWFKDTTLKDIIRERLRDSNTTRMLIQDINTLQSLIATIQRESEKISNKIREMEPDKHILKDDPFLQTIFPLSNIEV